MIGAPQNFKVKIDFFDLIRKLLALALSVMCPISFRDRLTQCRMHVSRQHTGHIGSGDMASGTGTDVSELIIYINIFYLVIFVCYTQPSHRCTSYNLSSFQHKSSITRN